MHPTLEAGTHLRCAHISMHHTHRWHSKCTHCRLSHDVWGVGFRRTYLRRCQVHMWRNQGQRLKMPPWTSVLAQILETETPTKGRPCGPAPSRSHTHLNNMTMECVYVRWQASNQTRSSSTGTVSTRVREKQVGFSQGQPDWGLAHHQNDEFSGVSTLRAHRT